MGDRTESTNATAEILVAAYQRDTGKMKRILRTAKENNKQIDVDVESSGITPLLWAVLNDDEESVRVLLDAGADANRKGPMGKTPEALAYAQNKLFALRALRKDRIQRQEAESSLQRQAVGE